LFHEGVIEIPTKRKFQGSTIPNLTDSGQRLIANTVNVPELDRERSGTKPSIFPEFDLGTISNNPSKPKFNRVDSPHKTLKKI
jgi:hypothetical protein